VATLLADRDGLVAGTHGGGTFRSLDEGASWQASHAGLPAGASTATLARQDDLLFAGTRRFGVYRSADGGATWAAANEGLPMGGRRLDIYALTAADGALYASHALGLHRSTDGGLSWRPLGGGLPAGEAFALLSAEGDVLLASDAVRLYRSTDGGRSWTWTGNGAWGGGLLRALASHPGILYAGTQGTAFSGVHRSTDGGETWRTLGEGLPSNAWSVSLGVAGDVLLAGVAGTGVWRRSLPPEPSSVSSTSPFHLGQNEPNPFSARTSIPYRLAAPGRVTLEVCDLYGNRLATLHASDEAPGEHRVDFDGDAFSAGLYLCRLTVGATSQVRQMLLLK
jgi:photosystem II stability/assembly factor-like uncharacterized protein